MTSVKGVIFDLDGTLLDTGTPLYFIILIREADRLCTLVERL